MKLNIHDKTLDNIIVQPHLIEENINNIVCLLREPIFLRRGVKDMQSMCDLVIGYKNYAVPIEIKATSSYRDKAIRQVLQGGKFIRENLRVEAKYGKIIYYNMHGDRRLSFETIEL